MAEPSTFDFEEQVALAVAALAAGGNSDWPLIDGRIVKVLATPENGSASYLAVGLAVLPASFCTTAHSHHAEEIALIFRGEGVIEVGDRSFAVRPGSVVVVPPDVPHTTSSTADGPLVVYWAYGPAGSEQRWLQHPSSAATPEVFDD